MYSICAKSEDGLTFNWICGSLLSLRQLINWLEEDSTMVAYNIFYNNVEYVGKLLDLSCGPKLNRM